MSRMTARLTTTSYAVLAQVAVHPWSTYELAQQRVRYFRYVWPRAESAIYREVKRLNAMGLLDGKKEHVVTTLTQVRDDAREMLRFGGEVKKEFLEGIAVTQDQVYIRALAVDFFISLLSTVEGWTERTLEEIGSWDDLSADGKNERALQKIRDLPVPTPDSVEKTPVPPRTQRRPR